MVNSEDAPIIQNYVTVSGRVTPIDGVYRKDIPVRISQEGESGIVIEEFAYTDNDGYYEITTLLYSSNDIIAKVGNDKATWQLIDGITLHSDKQIISYNGGNNQECATLTAQLTKNNSNVNIAGKTITFEIRKQSDDSLVETLTGTTDHTGKCSVSYTSKGAGDIYIKAECMFVSKICSIEDCIKTFKLDGTDNYHTFRSSSKSFNEGVMTAKSCVAYGFENLNSFRLEFEWLGGYAIIMPSDVTSIDRNWIQFWSTGGYVYINGSRNNLPTFSEPFVPMTDGFYKVILEKDNGTYRFKVEDTVICEFINVPSATEWAVGIDHYSTTNNKIRNIKVKPL